MNLMTFHSVGNFIITTDEVIFFRGVGIPPTSSYSDPNVEMFLNYPFRIFGELHFSILLGSLSKAGPPEKKSWFHSGFSPLKV